MNFALEAWKKYFGNGWTPVDMPSKQECFEAGFEAAIEYVKLEARFVPANIKYDLSNLEQDENGLIKIKAKE